MHKRGESRLKKVMNLHIQLGFPVSVPETALAENRFGKSGSSIGAAGKSIFRDPKKRISHIAISVQIVK